MKQKLYITFFGESICMVYDSIDYMLRTTEGYETALFVEVEIDTNDLLLICDTFPAYFKKARLDKISELEKELKELKDDGPANG